MRYAMIMAGGAGTRLWPMSRARMPKQLIPFIDGKSLIQIACDRLDGLVPPAQRLICAGLDHRAAIQQAVPEFDDDHYLAEPEGRDTLNAVAFAAAVVAQNDPDAVIAVFTADHIIEPVDSFQKIVTQGFELAERDPHTLVTFGIAPTHGATGFGYLELGEEIATKRRSDEATEGVEDPESGKTGKPEIPGSETRNPRPETRDPARPTAFVVDQFKEKPDAPTADQYHQAGPSKYLWNSGMFVWRAATLLDCVQRYQPDNHAALLRIAHAWDTPQRDDVVAEVYPTLKKISVDYAVMEPASHDPDITVAAVPMPLFWLDVGSWPAFAKTITSDDAGNVAATDQQIMLDCNNTLIASNETEHLVAAIGCEDLIIIHTADATLVCHADRAEDIKKMHGLVGERFGKKMV